MVQFRTSREKISLEYKFTLRLEPRTMFGLPMGDRLVVPSGTEIESPSLEVGSWKIAKHGTLPQYRRDDEKIAVEFEHEGLSIRLEDNFVYVELQANSSQDAVDRVLLFADNFVHALSLFAPNRVSFEVVSGWDEHRRPVQFPIHIHGSFTGYNLIELDNQIKQSMKLVSNLNSILRKSLEYYNHALFLNEMRLKIGLKSSEHHSYLLSDITLNLYKSVTIIVGDPAKDKDYQRRYKTYGIDYNFWKTKIDKLRDIRNNWDVAHYFISREKLEELDGVIGEAFLTTRQTLLQYEQHIESQKSAQ